MAAEDRRRPFHRLGERPGLRLALGGAVWLGYLALARPAPFDPAWPHALLLLAALVLVPAALGLMGGEAGRLLPLAAALQLPAAVLLAVSYALGQGLRAALLALPWLVFTTLVALAGLGRIRDGDLRTAVRKHDRDLGPLVIDAGLLFLAVGAAWTVSDRLGFRPLGFSPVIVLLTAVHFHYAGLVLPIVAGLAIRRTGGAVATLAGWGVIAGVPAVAVGITGSQLGLPTWIETAAAWTMAAAGLLVAWLHLRLVVATGHRPAARTLWAVAALGLTAGMVLAALYGSRFLAPGVRWLDIAWMQALHGAANSFGFALPALLGWWLVQGRSAGGGRPRDDRPTEPTTPTTPDPRRCR